MKKVYSPLQVSISAFGAGPIAGLAFIKENFDAMGNSDKSKLTIAYGSGIVLFFALVISFLPENFPNMIIPMLLGISSRLFVEKRQFTKDHILESEELTFHSTGRVIAFSLLYLLATIVLLFSILTLLE